MNNSCPQTEAAFLRGNADWRILRDGPALRVRRPGRSDQLLPLRRIHRIHSLGPIHWDTDALLACAEAGVPVYFCTREGDTPGRFLPATPRPLPSLGESLSHCLQSVTQTQRLIAWIDARQTILGNRKPHCGSAEQRLHTALEQLTHCARHPLKKAWHQLESLIRCALEHQLWQQGYDPIDLHSRLHGFHLEQLLAQLLLGELTPHMLRGFARLQKPPAGLIKPDFHRVVRIYHQLQARIQEAIDQLLYDLHHHLLETGKETMT